MICEHRILRGPHKGYRCVEEAEWEVKLSARMTAEQTKQTETTWHVCFAHLVPILKSLMEPYDQPAQVMRIA